MQKRLLPRRPKQAIVHRAVSPYAKIDWEKASILFQRPLPKREQTRQYPSTKEILHISAAAGAVGMMFIFPGAAVGLGALMLGGQRYSRWGTRRVISQLAKQRYVSVEEKTDGTVTVRITKQGMVRALTYNLETLQVQKPKRWDKKWRLVIFDIPERYRRLRDMFRLRLRQLGLYPLQESVFISAYSCFDEVEFLRELYGVAFSVRYLVVEKVEDDAFLLQRFGLS